MHLLSYGGCSVQPTLAIHLESPLIHLIVAGNLHEGKMSLPGSQNPAEDIGFFQQGAVYFCIQLQYRDANSAQVFNDVITSFNFTS